jgi:hypothetical protein
MIKNISVQEVAIICGGTVAEEDYLFVAACVVSGTIAVITGLCIGNQKEAKLSKIK